MRSFWAQILLKNHPKLERVKFAIYGLGDRGYGDNYNLCARKLRQRMLMLGADEVVEIGLGDEQDKSGNWGVYL